MKAGTRCVGRGEMSKRHFSVPAKVSRGLRREQCFNKPNRGLWAAEINQCHRTLLYCKVAKCKENLLRLRERDGRNQPFPQYK